MSDLIYRRFREQRAGAKQRKIEWQLPYWEWLQIWEESGRLNDRGTKKGCFVMARKGGYWPICTS